MHGQLQVFYRNLRSLQMIIARVSGIMACFGILFCFSFSSSCFPQSLPLLSRRKKIYLSDTHQCVLKTTSADFEAMVKRHVIIDDSLYPKIKTTSADFEALVKRHVIIDDSLYHNCYQLSPSFVQVVNGQRIS